MNLKLIIINILNNMTDNKKDNEIWKKIDKFPTYEINKIGEVRNIKTKYKLKCRKLLSGYLGFSMHDHNKIGNKILCRTQHRLLMETFIDNPNNYETVNHIDLDKTNNKLENLEWATMSQQVKHSYNNNINRKTKEYIKVLQLDMNNNIINTYSSISEASIKTNINYGLIDRRLKNNKPIKNFYFKYDIDTIENEIWKKYKDFNFEVSNKGRINLVKYNRITYGKINYTGYQTHKTTYLGQVFRFSVHRLVAELFIENPNNYTVVNHKNLIKTYNDVNNLEWCSQSDNTMHYYETKKNNNENIINHNKVKIIELSKDGNKIFNSMTDLLNILKIKKHLIDKIINNNLAYNDKYYIIYNEYIKDKTKYNDLLNNIKNVTTNIKHTNISNSLKVCKIDKNTDKILEIYDSISDAGLKNNVHNSSISSVCRGITKLSAGYKWKYYEEPTLDNEKWEKYLLNFYVSDLGRIKLENGRIITGCLNRNKYLFFKYNKKSLSIHRLVADLFVENPNNYKYIIHIDKDKLNNKSNNLIWNKNRV